MESGKIYDAQEHKDIKGIIYETVEKHSENVAFIIKHIENKNINYENITYKQFLEDINKFGTSLYEMGLKDKRIVVIGKNRYEWTLSHITILLGNMVFVPLDKDLEYGELEDSLIRSKADAIIFDDKLTDKIIKIKENGKTNLKQYICMSEKENFKSIKELIKNGEKLIENGKNEYINAKIDENKMGILLFTSGTTSKSKAVMLSQRSVASNIYALQCVEEIRPTDTNIAFLPLHHIFGSSCMIWILTSGMRTAFPDGLKYIKQNMNEYKVSVFVGVPALIEAMYKAIMKEVDKQGKTKVIKIAMVICNFLMKFHIDIRRKVFKQVLDALGGELRFVVSGGAPADPKISKGLYSLGVRTAQGYGLTETSPVIAGEDEIHRKYGTVGIPMINNTVEIVDKDEKGIGEIRVKGPNVMLGYYEMPEETNEVLKDGWLYTGDLGYIDKKGFLTITGRSKNMIVLKNGKKVFPEEIETMLGRIELIEECMVFGMPDEKDKNDLKLSVKVVYNQEVANEKYAGKNEEELRQIIWEEIKKINLTFPRYKHIQNMILSKEELIKTTTKKIRRQEEMKKILEKK